MTSHDRPPARAGTTGRVPAAVAAAVLLAATFGPIVTHEFVNWDDGHYTTRNVHVADLSVANIRWMLTDTHLFYWHPVAYLSHAVQNAILGDRAGLHHAVSLLLHAVNAWLVYLVGRAILPGARAGAGLLAAGLPALLFALHPLRVESVAWVAEQKGLLSTLFYLLTVLAYLRSRRSGEARRRRRAMVVAFLFAIVAMAAKPMAVTIPVLLLVLDAWPLGRCRGVASLPRLALEKWAFFAMATAVAVVSAVDPRQSDLFPEATAEGLLSRGVAVSWGLAFPLVRSAWPADLSPVYPAEPPGELTLENPRFLLSFLLLAGLTVACAAGVRRRPWLLAAWAAYLVTMAPVSGFRQAGSLATADRFTYLPTIPLWLLVGAAAAHLAAKRRRPTTVWVAGGGVCALFAVLSAIQVPVWRDSETMWTRVIAVYPGRVAAAHNNLGAVLHERGLRRADAGLLRKAAAQYEAALSLRPDHASSHNNLGLIAWKLGDRARARASFERAVALKPSFSVAHANLALLLLEMDNRESARRHYRLARETGGWVHPDILRKLGEGLR